MSEPNQGNGKPAPPMLGTTMRHRLGQPASFLSYRRFLGFAAIAVAVAIAAIVLWQLSYVILLGFGAVLIAMLFQVVAEPIQRWTVVPAWAALMVSGLVVLGLFFTAAWVFGSQLVNEVADVTKRAVSAADSIRASLGDKEAGRFVLHQIRGTSFSVTAVLQRVFWLGTSTSEALIVVGISAIYLVAQPHQYRHGFVLLFPEHLQAEARATIDEIGRALRLWLLGQIIQMSIIGALSALAVWLIGLPSVLALGLIAAVAEFVPYLGPIIAAVPAILVALTRSPHAALWTLLAYLLIHQIEGNIVTPLIQRWLIFVPPALMLFGIAAIGTLFGFPGFVFAGPIVVVLYVAVKKLYLRDLLGEQL
jgi:predicted PurR-regulated permease PerM